MAEPPAADEQMNPRTRYWPSLLGILLLVAVITTMVVAPVLVQRDSTAARTELTDELEPFRFALDAYNLDIVRVAAEARAYAAFRSPRAHASYDQAVTALQVDGQQFLALAPASGFEQEAADFASKVNGYRSISAAIVAAESAGNDFESFRLIEQEGEPQLIAIQAEADALIALTDTKSASLRSDISSNDDRTLVVLVLTGALGLMTAAILTWLLIRNIRLSQRIDEQRRRLDNVISDVPGIVWEAWGRPDSANQRIDFVSQYVEEMLGYSVDEWLSTPNFWLTIVHPDDQETAAAQAAATFNSGSPGTNRFRWLTKDGRAIWVEGYSSVIRDSAGQPVGMRGVTLDISAQVSAASALERERARFSSIVTSAGFGVYQTDGQGLLEYINPAGERLLGYDMESLVGRHTHLAFHHTRSDGTSYPVDECPIYRAAIEDVPYTGVETFTTSGGTRIPVEVTSTPIIVAGRPTGAVVAFQDISERLRQEAMRDDFVAFASHELRNPLTSLKGFSRWLSERARTNPGRFDPDSTEAIETLVEEAERMESIIDLFLDLARLETNRLTFDLEPVNLRHILADECERLRIRYPHATCDSDLDQAVAVAHSDEHRLRQVIGNLLDNAAKYSGEKPSIRLVASGEPGVVSISIRDNGPGIPIEDQPYVFERYYRGRAGASRQQGLGVGLFITKQIVDRLGGTLTFASSPAGTEFILRLPLPIDDLESADDSLPPA